MKSKIFKIVLPALTLMFAITASLAFTSNSTDAPETYYYEESPKKCTSIVTEEENCSCLGTIPCTIQILGTPYHLFEGMHEISSKCVIPLWEIE